MKFNEAKVQLGSVETEKFGKFKSIQWLNTKIHEYLIETYGPYGYKYADLKILNIDGQSIDSEYIDLMVNNITTFKYIIRTNRLTTEDGFYHFMINNFDNYYNSKGKYFKDVTKILYSTKNRGNIGEVKSFKYFEELLSKRGLNIKVDTVTLDEDIAGIDGKFIWKSKIITIQVKPFKSITMNGTEMKIFSQGSLSLNTDYLILYKNDEFIVSRGSDVKIEGSYFVIDESKVVK